MSECSEDDEPPGDLRLDKKYRQEQWLELMMEGDHKLSEFEAMMDQKKVNPRYRFYRRGTCLEIACRTADKGRFVRALLKRVGPSVNNVIPEPIHYAAREGAVDAMVALLNHKDIDLNVVDTRGETALHYLAKYYKPEPNYRTCLDILLKRRDLDINKANKTGFTIIHQAASYNKLEMVEQILKHRRDELDLDSECGNGRTARECLTQKYPKLVPLLPPDRRKLSAAYRNQLLDAFYDHQTDMFRRLLQQVDEDGNPVFDVNYHYGEPYNETCLEMACEKQGWEDIIKILLAAGADPNLVNPHNYMVAIHIAAKALNYNALKILLENRITHANAVDHKGQTALHYAVASSGLEFFKHLPTTPDEEDEQKADPLLKNFKNCIEILHKHISAPVDNEDLLNLLNSSEGNPQLIQKLKEVTRNILEVQEIKPVDEYCELRECLCNGQAEEFINGFRDRVKKEDESFKQQKLIFLQLAIKNDLPLVVSELLDNDTDPNDSSSTGPPPVIMATMHRDITMLQRLLKVPGVDVNITDGKGDTALHHAVRAENFEGIIALLNHGADIGIENVLGKTPLPARSLQALLNRSLRTNDDAFPGMQDYEVIFDYTFLTASKIDFKEEIDDDDDSSLVSTGGQGDAKTAEEGNRQSGRKRNEEKRDTGRGDGGNEESKRDKEGKDHVAINLNQDSQQNEQSPLMTPRTQTPVPSGSAVYQAAGKGQVAVNPKHKKKKALMVLKAETEMLHYISKHNQEYKDILNHPVVSSFLEFKWRCVSYLFYLNIILYVFFFIVLNLYIVYSPVDMPSSIANNTLLSKCFFIDYPDSVIDGNSFDIFKNSSCYLLSENDTSFPESSLQCSEVLKLCSGSFDNVNRTSDNISCLESDSCLALTVILAFCTVLLFLREIFQVYTIRWDYWKNPENYLDLGIVGIVLAIMFLPRDNPDLESCFVFAILLSSCELILLLGREPRFSRNIEMLKTVTVSYVGLFFTFLTIILAFSHCLYIVFRQDMQKEGVHKVLWTICRTIVFMTGEYEADSLHFSAMPITSATVFLLFVFFISIVLLNLLIGLSVNNTKMIEETSEIVCITSRINLIYDIENTMLRFHKAGMCCMSLSWCKFFKKLTETVILFPNGMDDKVIITLQNTDGNLKHNPIENSSYRKSIYSIISAVKRCFRNRCGLKRQKFKRIAPKMDKNTLEEAVKIISNKSQNKMWSEEKKRKDIQEKLLGLLSDLE